MRRSESLNDSAARFAGSIFQRRLSPAEARGIRTEKMSEPGGATDLRRYEESAIFCRPLRGLLLLTKLVPRAYARG